MIELPDGLTLQRTTPTFDESSVPAGLVKAHSVADGVWGRLVVSAGSIGFVFDDEPDAIRTVTAGETQVIPPLRKHHLVVGGPATFAVEFHR